MEIMPSEFSVSGVFSLATANLSCRRGKKTPKQNFRAINYKASEIFMKLTRFLSSQPIGRSRKVREVEGQENRKTLLRDYFPIGSGDK
jgi:hypothetical protein